MQLSYDQKEAFALMSDMNSDRNVFLTGKAGTGKSFLVRYFLKQTDPKKILLAAPTGIAAQNIGGVTLHRLFGISIHPHGPAEYSSQEKIGETLLAANVLFIDEVSMVRADTFQYIYNTIKHFNATKLKIIAVGDFLQLAPVMPSADETQLRELWGAKLVSPYPFDTDAWKELKFTTYELTENHRQDENEKSFVESLHDIREGKNLEKAVTFINSHAKIITEQQIAEDDICLCPFNKKADSINTMRLDRLSGNMHVYYAVKQGMQDRNIVEDELKLKPGALVMAITNDPEGFYQNGSIGVVQACNEDSVTVRFETEREELEEKDGQAKMVSYTETTTINVTPYVWEFYNYKIDLKKQPDGKFVKELQKTVVGRIKQIPLKLAWALTIHKGQGKTLRKAVVFPDFFTEGHAYVALSRVTKIAGLSLTKPIKASVCMASNRAKEFYRLNGAESRKLQTQTRPQAQPQTVAENGLRPELFLSKEDISILKRIASYFTFPEDATEEERLSETLHAIIMEKEQHFRNVESEYEFSLQKMSNAYVPQVSKAASNFRRFIH